MNYTIYILLVLCLLLVCILVMHMRAKSSSKSKQARSASRSRRQLVLEQTKSLRSTRSSLELVEDLPRELSEIQTPWGWPGGNSSKRSRNFVSGRKSPPGRASANAPMSRWVDRLIAEKQTVNDREYILKKDASLRAMLEDRFGQADYAQDNDRKDSPGSRARPGRKATGAVPHRGKPSSEAHSMADDRLSRLKNIKTPKGW